MPKMSIALVLVCQLLAGLAMPAQAVTITSVTTGNWNSTATWTPALIPTSADSVGIASGHVVTLQDASAARSIYIAGQLLSNGKNLTVDNIITGGSSGYLYITGSSLVTTNDLNQNQKLAKVYIEGTPTVNIKGIHSFFPWTSGGLTKCCSIMGGTVNYTGTASGTSSSIYFASLDNMTAGCGWFATGGTVNIYGNLYAAKAGRFWASENAIIKFTGAASSTVQLNFSGSSGKARGEWNFNNLVIEKTDPAATVTFLNNSSSNVLNGCVRANNVDVASGQTLYLQGWFVAGPDSGYLFSGKVTNNGSIYRDAGANNNITTQGYFRNDGTFSNTTTAGLTFGGFEDNGTYANGTASVLTVNGDFSNAASATFSNSGNADLNFNGSFANNQTTAYFGTGKVTFGGSSDATVYNVTPLAFSLMTVSMGAQTTTLKMNSPVTVSTDVPGALTIESGTLVTNGQALTVNAGASTSVLGAQFGKLDITAGGTVTLRGLDQGTAAALKEVSVSGDPTVNIFGVHSLHCQNNRFSVLGGTVNYQFDGTQLSLPDPGTDVPSGGWFATGGTVSFSRDISAVSRAVFVASGDAVIKFEGGTTSSVKLHHSATNYPATWEFGNLRAEKTAGARVVFRSAGTGQLRTAVRAGTVTILPGAAVELGGLFSAGTGYRVSSDILNDGGLTLLNDEADWNNNLYVAGSWSGTGAFAHGGKPVAFDGSGNKTVTLGSGSFYDLTVNKPAGSLSLAGNLAAERNLLVSSGTLVVGERTLTLGTGSAPGSVVVNSPGTFSVVGSALDARGKVTAAGAGYPYVFAVNSGGTIAAQHADFKWMDANGIQVNPGAAIDPTDNFSDCTFDHGDMSGQMLRIANTQDVGMGNVGFYGSAGNNIVKPLSVVSGRITVSGGGGTRWGQAYELDPNGLIDWVFPRDVGAVSITTPVPQGRYDFGQLIRPEATWRNNGNVAATFEAWMILADPLEDGRVYCEKVDVTDLPAGTPITVNTFPSHVLSTTGVWSMRCSTYYADDQNPNNDLIDDGFFVVGTDVGAVAIAVPQGSYPRGSSIMPRATWRNYGNVPASFEAWMILADPLEDGRVYYEKVTVPNLAPGVSITVSTFPSCPLPTIGAWTVRCSTYCAGDQYPGNDLIDGGFFVANRDVGVVSIEVPQGRYPRDTTITPVATWQNFGNVVADFEAWMILAGPSGAREYSQKVDVSGLAAGRDTTINAFPSHQLSTLGGWTVRCSTYFAGDEYPGNDVIDDGFQVATGWPEGWTEVKPMPQEPTAKPVKDGGWLTVDGSQRIFAAKGYKTGDFYSYDAVLDAWQTLASIPPDEAGKTKPPSKGCVGVSDGVRYVYMSKGNNTLGFWRYDIARDTWVSLPGVPEGPNRKKVKGGTDMVYAVYKDTGCVVLLKGYKTEFYRYNTEAERWDTLPNAPAGGGKAKYDKGSFLVYDQAGHIYAHQAKYYDKLSPVKCHYMFRYDVQTGRWTDTLKGMPLLGWHGGKPGKNKKSKDGAGGAWLDENMYALKGGNTQQFFKYIPLGDSWYELDTLPAYGSTGKRKYVKYGADLVSYGFGAFFALKGNKTLDLWRYVTPADGLQLTANGRSGVMSGSGLSTVSRMLIAPNPLSSGFATLRYSLPKAGPVAVMVFDVAGRSVFRQSTIGNRQSTMSLDLRKVPAGVYLVRLDADGYTVTQKLVVQRQ